MNLKETLIDNLEDWEDDCLPTLIIWAIIGAAVLVVSITGFVMLTIHVYNLSVFFGWTLICIPVVPLLVWWVKRTIALFKDSDI